MYKRRTHAKQNRTGATAVEFAIVAPVFFLILFAMFEFSRVNVLRHTADNAAYEASRVAIIPGATAADGTLAGMNSYAAGIEGDIPQ